MTNVLTLPAELTIYTVSELQPIWTTWLAEFLAKNDADEAPVRADAQSVDTVDAAGLQLVAALARTLSEQGHRLRLINASAPLVEACELLGLSEFLSAADDRKVSA